MIVKIFLILLVLTIATHIAIKLIGLTLDKTELALMLATNEPPKVLLILTIINFLLSILTTISGVIAAIMIIFKLWGKRCQKFLWKILI